MARVQPPLAWQAVSLASPGLRRGRQVIGDDWRFGPDAAAAAAVGPVIPSEWAAGGDVMPIGADFQRRVEANLVSREDTVRQIVARIQLREAFVAFIQSARAQQSLAKWGFLTLQPQ